VQQGHWDRSRARLALGGEFPISLFRFANWVPSPTSGYVSRSPPIIPDGQISRVRFETSTFLRGPSQMREVKTLVRIRPFFIWFAHSLVSRPALALRRFYQAGHQTDEETAKCPEPLCPTLVLPRLGRRFPSPPRALPLCHRSYGLMCHSLWALSSFGF
jgi:hypothetical protein